MGSAGALVTHCVINGNVDSYYNGGGGIYMSAGTVRNCLITGNRVTLAGATVGGGGIHQAGGQVVSCTVVSNRVQNADNIGGGVWWKAGSITNTIIYGNTRVAASNDLVAASQATIGYSCAPELTNATGNLPADPVFIDRAAGNYRLAPGSPCMNAAIALPWMTGAADLDGVKRIITARPDMGAYEFWPSTVLVIR